jgi:hypothetical protein
MAKAKRGSKSDTAQYANYKSSGKEAKNRLIKLTRLAKEQPNNTQIASALKDIHHRRNTPKVPTWSHQSIALAKIVRHFKGKFDKGWLSTDPILHAAATHVRNEKIFENYKPVSTPPHQMGWLRERAHTKDGTLLWMV